MTERLDPVGAFSQPRRISGTSRLLLGFIAGALFALLPIYYYYMGRDEALRSRAIAEPHASPAEVGGRVEAASAAGDEARFASRMTYELAHAPEAPPAPAPSKLPLAADRSAAAEREAAIGLDQKAPAEPPRQAAARADESLAPATRVANARPIRPDPLHVRDTTAEIEKESRRSSIVASARTEAHSGRAQSAAEVAVAAGPSAPARGVATKPPIDTQAVLAPGSAVRGVTPITRSAEPVQRTEPTLAAAPAKPQAPAQKDIVEARLAATHEWLAAAPHTTHTIQIMGAHDEEQLSGHLKALSKLLEPNKIFVFRTVAQGRPAITVVYGAYADRESALQALEQLPGAVTVNRPLLRTVNGIRTEMKQKGTSG